MNEARPRSSDEELMSHVVDVGNFAHVYNRGTEKRIIFQDSQDYARFIHYLYILNDHDRVYNICRNINDRGLASIMDDAERKKIVNIVCYCLMPNHFHLLLHEQVENSISKFMQRLGTAYTMYFNSKNERTGVLFQGKFKSREINDERYLLELSRYIHLNPIDLLEPEWKEKGLTNKHSAIEFVGKYKWSSYLDYKGTHNFPSVLDKNILEEHSSFTSGQEYKEFVEENLSDFETDIEDLYLDFHS